MFKFHCFLSIPGLEGISHPLPCAKHFFPCLSLIPPLTVWKCHGSGSWAWPNVASQTILAFLIKLFLFLPSNALSCFPMDHDPDLVSSHVSSSPLCFSPRSLLWCFPLLPDPLLGMPLLLPSGNLTVFCSRPFQHTSKPPTFTFKSFQSLSPFPVFIQCPFPFSLLVFPVYLSFCLLFSPAISSFPT